LTYRREAGNWFFGKLICVAIDRAVFEQK